MDRRLVTFDRGDDSDPDEGIAENSGVLTFSPSLTKEARLEVRRLKSASLRPSAASAVQEFDHICVSAP